MFEQPQLPGTEPVTFVQSHTHSHGFSTEKSAALKAEIKALSTKDRIVKRLSEKPEGLTPDEFCKEVNGLINTIRRRFTDLWKEGKIRHHPESMTRLNDSKNECVVWILGKDPNLKMSRFEKMSAEITRLQALLKSNGIDFE